MGFEEVDTTNIGQGGRHLSGVAATRAKMPAFTVNPGRHAGVGSILSCTPTTALPLLVILCKIDALDLRYEPSRPTETCILHIHCCRRDASAEEFGGFTPGRAGQHIWIAELPR